MTEVPLTPDQQEAVEQLDPCSDDQKIKLTPDQQAAIDQQGHDILVSASAGSGKTKVLVDRIIQKITDNQADINNLLVVTFTEAAAREMQVRIQKALAEKSRLETNIKTKQRLNKQLSLVPSANISTLHAFCLTVIRKFYYTIDLDPVFRLLSDQDEQLMIKQQVLKQILEQYYAAEDADFQGLVRNFSNAKNNETLTEMIFSLLNFANANADKEAWFNQVLAVYPEAVKTVTEIPYFENHVRPQLVSELSNAKEALNHICLLTEDADYLNQYDELAQSLLVKINQIIAQNADYSWKDWQDKVDDLIFKSLPRVKLEDPSEVVLKDQVVNHLKAYKKHFQTLQTDFLLLSSEMVIEIHEKSRRLVAKLIEVTKIFENAYQLEKKRRHLLDFNDLEHLCLAILENPEVSQFYQTQFIEIMVDEYQDTNRLQEAILQKITRKNPGNLYMVGDVKQSIYGFRLADPSLFLDKYKQFKQLDNNSQSEEPGNKGQRIVLGDNFRSRENIDDFVNLIFSQIMSEDLGDMAYDDDAHLKFGATDYPEDLPERQTKLLVFETKNESNLNHGLDKVRGQIHLIAKQIQALLNETIFDKDTKKNRLITFKDIAILAPTKQNNLEILEIFKKYQIPTQITDIQNFFKATEVQIMLAYLKLIDNPQQDIPLAAVLRSPIVGLDENQLAIIRINHKTGAYYEALEKFIANFSENKQSQAAKIVYQKVTAFLNNLDTCRTVARQESLVNLIWHIYQQTGYLDYVGAMPAGKQRQLNLHALYQKAASYEENGFKGLFDFITFIENLQKQDKDLEQPNNIQTDDAVRVMTIHKSKGLEFPIVFMMDANHRFNEMDLHERAIFDDKTGIGIDYLNEQQRILYTTFPKILIKKAKQAKNIAEQMRVLYVALTRAEQQLIIVGAVDSEVKTIEKWSKALYYPDLLLPVDLRKQNNFLDWIGMSIVRLEKIKNVVGLETKAHTKKLKELDVCLKFFDESNLGELPSEQPKDEDWLEKQSDSDAINTDDQKTLDQIFNNQYSQSAATKTAAYQGVSEIKRLFEDPDSHLLKQHDFETAQSANIIRNETLATPKFLTPQVQSATSIGSATHLVFKKIDLTKAINQTTVQSTIDELIIQKLIDQKSGQAIDIAAIIHFFNATEIGQSMIQHPEFVHREVPFSLLLPAHLLYTEFKDNQSADNDILVHGIIDAYYDDGKQCRLIDYKTDHTQQSDLLKKRYQGQLKIYSEALSRIIGRRVDEKIIYALNLKETINL